MSCVFRAYWINQRRCSTLIDDYIHSTSFHEQRVTNTMMGKDLHVGQKFSSFNEFDSCVRIGLELWLGSVLAKQ